MLQKEPTSDLSVSLQKALNRALGGGLAGAGAMVIQVSTLMPMRTTMNMQYRFGGSAKENAFKLYAEGGIRRFYRGIGPALIQGPLSRFGDTAANAGMLSLLDSLEETQDLPIAVKTIAASAASASFRILLTPIDTLKTSLQVGGQDATKVLMNRVRTQGVSSLWYGATASASATFVGHYPWFAMYNYLQATLPKFGDDTIHKLSRNAVIGFSASVTSDTISNSLRVVKTYRQTHPDKVSYPQAIRDILAKDGMTGLFGRGLKTRIAANGLQGVMFSILWKSFEELLKKN